LSKLYSKIGGFILNIKFVESEHICAHFLHKKLCFWGKYIITVYKYSLVKCFFMIIKPPFLQPLRDVIRVKRYSLQTEKINGDATQNN